MHKFNTIEEVIAFLKQNVEYYKDKSDKLVEGLVNETLDKKLSTRFFSVRKNKNGELLLNLIKTNKGE